MFMRENPTRCKGGRGEEGRDGGRLMTHSLVYHVAVGYSRGTPNM